MQTRNCKSAAHVDRTPGNPSGTYLDVNGVSVKVSILLYCTCRQMTLIMKKCAGTLWK